jgi:hypothetical protein
MDGRSESDIPAFGCMPHCINEIKNTWSFTYKLPYILTEYQLRR